MGLTVSQSPSSECAHMPRLFRGPDCFRVSTCCTYIDLGSWGYFGVNITLVHYVELFPSSYHHKIFRSCYHDSSEVHAKIKVKVTEVKTLFSHFRAITPVWIHIWQWNNAQSLMLLRRGALFSSMTGSLRLYVCPSHLFHYVPTIVSWIFQELLATTEVMDLKWCTKLDI